MARLTIQADIDTYGAAIIADGQTPMQLNDVIYFLTDKNANDTIYSSTSWTSARIGATLWIQGGAYNCIEIGSEIALTMPSNAANPNHIHFFSGQGLPSRTSTGLASRTMQFTNFDYLIIDFETNTRPGLRDGWGSGRGGTFGLRASNTWVTKNSMGINVQHRLTTMKRLEIRGCELTMGDFAKIRTTFDKNALDSLIIERCLLTRSVGGEGTYVGTTQGTPYPIHKNLKVRDNLIICTAAEAIQLQQCGDGSEIHNNVIWCADHDWRSPFQQFQDTGMQIEIIQGDVKVYDNIIMGHGTAGLHLYGANGSGETPAIPFGSGVPQIYNNCFLAGKKGISIRMNDSFIQPVKCILRDNDIISNVGGYEVGADVNYLHDIDQVTTPVQIIGGRVPVGSVFLNPSEANTNVNYFNVTSVAQDEPAFVNSGFVNIPVHKISKWAETYEVGQYFGTSATSTDPALLLDAGTHTMTTQSGLGFAAGQKVKVFSRAAPTTKYFYADVNTYSGSTLGLNNISERNGAGAAIDWDIERRIEYTTADFVWLMVNDSTIPIELHKCMLGHTSHTTVRPDIATGTWLKVNWDVNGKNEYDPAYNLTPFTTDFMLVAGDFRLVKGSTHHLLGRGLSCNEQRDDQTRMGWQWKETPTGTVRDIPGAYANKLTLARYSYLLPGRYYRFWVEKLNDNTGIFDTREYSAWSQVT